jgi:hypothetical protein
MKIYDDIFSWEGFGGKLRLASGKCRLRIFDLNKDKDERLVHLRPFVVVASDLADSKMTVRSCCSHIATMVAKSHHIPPHRIQFVEYYPEVRYGGGKKQHIPQRFDAVEFVWKKGLAIHPKWRAVEGPLLDFLLEQVDAADSA